MKAKRKWRKNKGNRKSISINVNLPECKKVSRKPIPHKLFKQVKCEHLRLPSLQTHCISVIHNHYRKNAFIASTGIVAQVPIRTVMRSYVQVYMHKCLAFLLDPCIIRIIQRLLQLIDIDISPSSSHKVS